MMDSWMDCFPSYTYSRGIVNIVGDAFCPSYYRRLPSTELQMSNQRKWSIMNLVTLSTSPLSSVTQPTNCRSTKSTLSEDQGRSMQREDPVSSSTESSRTRVEVVLSDQASPSLATATNADPKLQEDKYAQDTQLLERVRTDYLYISHERQVRPQYFRSIFTVERWKYASQDCPIFERNKGSDDDWKWIFFPIPPHSSRKCRFS